MMCESLIKPQLLSHARRFTSYLHLDGSRITARLALMFEVATVSQNNYCSYSGSELRDRIARYYQTCNYRRAGHRDDGVFAQIVIAFIASETCSCSTIFSIL